LFPERNDAYERYRLSLGPYRAAKAVVTKLYGATIDEREENGEYRVELDDQDLTDTAFHNEFENWLNSYRDLRERCNNQDGNGEPGSLPAYKSEWPEPPADEGVMLSREAVSEIGISYADDDPIFFPYENDQPYRLPLPDGRYLSVDGIVESPEQADEGDDEDPSNDYTVDTLLVAVARGRDEDLETVVTGAVSELLKQAVDGEMVDGEITLSRDPAGPRTELEIELSERHERFLEALVDEEELAEEDDTIGRAIDVALERSFETAGPTEIDLDGTLLEAIRSILSEDESVDQFVAETLRERVLNEI